MSEKIRITSSTNNRALIDECKLEEYLERGWVEGWPEDKAVDDQETPEPTSEIADDEPKATPPDVEVVETPKSTPEIADDEPKVTPPETEVAETEVAE